MMELNLFLIFCNSFETYRTEGHEKVSDSSSIEILTRYMNFFDTETGRFFRKIKDDLTSSMVPIGQGMISSYPKKLQNFYNYAFDCFGPLAPKSPNFALIS